MDTLCAELTVHYEYEMMKNAFVNQHYVLIYERIFVLCRQGMIPCRSPPSIRIFKKFRLIEGITGEIRTK